MVDALKRQRISLRGFGGVSSRRVQFVRIFRAGQLPLPQFCSAENLYSCAIFWPFISFIVICGLPQIPFYPYAISIILDDDPDINDQELDGQQQVLFPTCIIRSFEPLVLLCRSHF